MKAYKIKGTISAETYIGTELRSQAEYFYLNKEDAMKNINMYIDGCANRGIELRLVDCYGDKIVEWVGIDKKLHTYKVRLEEIEVKEKFGD